jgi:hypothetical protein
MLLWEVGEYREKERKKERKRCLVDKERRVDFACLDLALRQQKDVAILIQLRSGSI